MFAHGFLPKVQRPVAPAQRSVRSTRVQNSDAVIDVSAEVSDDASVAVAMGNAPYPSVVEGVELYLESPLDGKPNSFLAKGEYVAPGAAVMFAFDEIRAQAKGNLAEPGFRPGDIPPWIKTQMVEFSLTTVMEDLVKFSLEANGLEVLDDQGNEESMIKWDEDPSALAKGEYGV